MFATFRFNTQYNFTESGKCFFTLKMSNSDSPHVYTSKWVVFRQKSHFCDFSLQYTIHLPWIRETFFRFDNDFTNLGLALDDSSRSYSKYSKVSTSTYTPTSTYSSGYTPRGRFEIRSQTPSFSSSETSNIVRKERDYQSMSRFSRERSTTRERSDDDVEKTFEKLYHRYVKNAPETSSSSENSKRSSRKED